MTPGEIEFIAGYNDEYSFELESKKNDSRRVKYLGKDNERVLNDLLKKRLLFVGMLLFHQDVFTVFKGKGTNIGTFKGVSNNGRQYIEVTFKSEDQHSESYRIMEGRVVFDPELQWSIIEYDLVLLIGGEKTLLSARNEYAETVSWISFPVRHSLTARAEELPERPPITEFVAEYHNIALGDATKQDCTLEAFGLPKPGISKPSNNVKWKLIVINLFVIALVAALIAYRKKTQPQ